MNYIITITKTNYDDVEEEVYQNEVEVEIDDEDEEEIVRDLLKEATKEFSK